MLQKGWLPPGQFHYALLSGLTPAHRYYYRFGADPTGFSQEFSFLAPPASDSSSEVKVIVLADMGQAELDGSDEQSEMVPSGNTTRLMIAEASSGEYSLVAHFGDISYARGHVSQWDRCDAPPACKHHQLSLPCSRQAPPCSPAARQVHRMSTRPRAGTMCKWNHWWPPCHT